MSTENDVLGHLVPSSVLTTYCREKIKLRALYFPTVSLLNTESKRYTRKYDRLYENPVALGVRACANFED